MLGEIRISLENSQFLPTQPWSCDCIYIYAGTLLAFLLGNAVCKEKRYFLQVCDLFGALKESTAECFQETLLLFLKHFVSESVSQCNAAFCFLSVDLNDVISQLFV